MEQIKPYKKEAGYSYTLGAFPTIELLACRPFLVKEVLVHSSFTDRETVDALCGKAGIPVTVSDKTIARLSDKENCFVVGVFEKYTESLKGDAPHIVLVNPGNMGNLGTILRTAAAMGIYDIAIISPGVDSFHPKAVRASMGALFRLRHRYYDSFESYRREFSAHGIFCFMLNGEHSLALSDVEKPELFSLVFGNEASGLPAEFASYGQSVIIPQTEAVDSLNLTIAVGIGSYIFMKENLSSRNF